MLQQFTAKMDVHWEIAGLVYLDHAGATLYSELQLEAIFKDLNSRVYGNPRILVCI